MIYARHSPPHCHHCRFCRRHHHYHYNWMLTRFAHPLSQASKHHYCKSGKMRPFSRVDVADDETSAPTTTACTEEVANKVRLGGNDSKSNRNNSAFSPQLQGLLFWLVVRSIWLSTMPKTNPLILYCFAMILRAKWYVPVAENRKIYYTVRIGYMGKGDQRVLL